MRVGIDYRILAVGPYLMRRGMGRYTQQQLRAVLAAGGDDEYLLLCGAEDDVGLIDPAIRRARGVSIAVLPAGAVDDHNGTTLAAAEAFQAWARGLGIDVYHATTPFHVGAPIMAAWDACPVVATLYDFIPLLYPEHYMEGQGGRNRYQLALDLVRRADRHIAISEATGADAQRLLGISADTLHVAYPIADERFRVMPADAVERVLAGLGRRLRVPQSFALAVTFPHHTKNLPTMLAAYARLPESLRLQVPLLLACNVAGEWLARIMRPAAALGVADDIVVTGLLTDEELAALYNAATLVVHASGYEGFGLPVLEAMRCGTPVITSKSSSLPEVVGDAGLLVHPDDDAALADAMVAVIESPGQAAEMAERGLLQARRFDAGQLAEATRAAYRRACGGRPKAGGARARLAMWTPVPPQPSGVADAAAELAVELGTRCDVEVFVDDGVIPDAALLGDAVVHHWSAFGRRREQAPFDATIYQVGASLFHSYLWDAAQQEPGVAVIHDLPWSYARYAHHVGAGRPEAFEAELEALEGPAALEEYRTMVAGGRPAPDASASDFWNRHPMLGPLIERSAAVVVHAEEVGEALAARYPGVRPVLVPLGVSDPVGTAAASVAELLGCEPGTAVVAAFGIVHPAKRLEACVDALAAVLRTRPDTVLAFVGEAVDPSYERDLRVRAERLGVGHAVRFTGRVERPVFDSLMAAADVVVNLRSASLQQMSSTLIRALAAGRPVVVSDSYSSAPPVCRRVRSDEEEAEALAAELLSLLNDAALRERLGSEGRSWFDDNATMGVTADRYLDMIAGAIGRPLVTAS